MSKTMTVSALLDRLACERGNIQCSNEFTIEQMEQAKTEGRFAVGPDYIGYVFTPRLSDDEILSTIANAPVSQYIKKLEAINAELLAACDDANRMYSELSEHALAGRPAMVPVTIMMRLKAAIANAQPQGE